MVDDSIIQKVISLAIEIQQIPSPTFAELEKAVFLRDVFIREGLDDVTIDEIGNVYARMPGRSDKAPLIISAHSDTVFPESIDLFTEQEKNRIYGPGIGDNSLGVAGLLGLLRALRFDASLSEQGNNSVWDENLRLPGDLWLVVNVSEEGLGDLRGMRAVVDRFADEPLAYVVLEGMALGQVYHRGLGVQRYRINVETQGGHSWVDYGTPSAINELARLILRLESIPLPEKPRTTLNVGVVSGGTTVNTIAANAELELDLRSESKLVLGELIEKVETLIGNSNNAETRITSDVIGARPAGRIPAEHPLIQIAVNALISEGIKPTLSVGSTDANIPLSLGYPAVCLGLSTGGGAHTTGEYINTDYIGKGLSQLVTLVKDSFRLL